MFRRISTKLYAALGLAVLLTLLSSGVGVYYFEVSGDLSHGLSREAFPAVEDAWRASDAVARITAFGERELSRVAEGHAPEADALPTVSAGADLLVEELRTALSRPGGLAGLSEPSERVLQHAWAVADVLSGLDEVGSAMYRLRLRSDELRKTLGTGASSSSDYGASRVLYSALSATTIEALDLEWENYAVIAKADMPSDSIRELAEGDNGVFAVRQSWLSNGDLIAGLSASFDERSALMLAEADQLVDEVSSVASVALEGSLASFDQGRVLLFGISAISVVLATLVAWLWVGNMVVRRLSRLSDRIRAMAAGDLDTPVPEVGSDEIGQLGSAVEIFRRQALEVQRLNLVEKLYGELRSAYEELELMQARLVAQEKLAALGEIVAGVAHEISNPLSFVKNFAEGSGSLSVELFEMLDGYREQLGDDDRALLDEIREELSDSLGRIQANGTRALTIVRRMQSLGVVGGDLVLTALHPVLARAVRVGCDTFASDWGDFTVEPAFDLSDNVGEVSMAPGDFSEAVVNLVTNACYAMRMRRESGDQPSYEPRLVVSSQIRDGEVAVVVSDNGTGIAEDVLPSIFNPFFTTRAGALGAGLGLPLAADVIRRGGGSLTVETTFGFGSAFTATLPVAVPPGAAGKLEERFGADVSAVRAFGTANGS